MKNWLHKIKFPFIRNKRNSDQKSGYLESYYSVEDIIADSYLFYDRNDLLYFPKLKTFGAFKYKVVKDILTNNKDITVSDVHIDLNSIYFSLNENKHQNNKKAAYKHLDFLSKKNKNEPNEFTRKLFDFLKSKFPLNELFDLTEYLINPLTFINILNEYGFLEFMPQYNPWHKLYNHEKALKLINDYYNDSNLLTIQMLNYIKEGNEIPNNMKHFISEMESDYKMNNDLLAKFFSSMIFSATHSTASFLCSYIYIVFTKYPNLLEESNDSKLLEYLEEEVLRLYMPVQWVFRTVRKDTQYSGINLKAGDTIMLFIGAANLDPNAFEDPLQIKFDRKLSHLSFGMGPYACIGKFATHRIAANLITYITEFKSQIKFLNNNEKHKVHNAILKIPLIVTFTEN